MVSVTDVIARLTGDFSEEMRKVQGNQLLLMKEQRKLAMRQRKTRALLRR